MADSRGRQPSRRRDSGGKPRGGSQRGSSDRRGRSTKGSAGSGSGRNGSSRYRGDASSGRGSKTSRSGDGDRGHGSESRTKREDPKARRRDLKGAAANLPNWVIESLARVTPEKRVAGALTALGEASEAFADGAFQRAVRKAETAKELAPRDATIREVLGLAAYRLGDWQKSLAELRAFRRMAGETTHLPVEMDVLRALGRVKDVDAAWDTLRQRGGKPAVMKEGSVVYASHLVDQGDLDGAWKVVGGRKLVKNPFPEDLRQWYVAAKVAALRGDPETASRIRNAILENDPAFPGIDELESLIARS